MRRATLALLALATLAGCSKDFDAFAFDGMSDAAMDAATGMDAGDLPPIPGSDTGPVQTGMGDAATADGGDAALDAADPDDDAGSPRSMCSSEFASVPPAAKSDCSGCACELCSVPLLDCLSSGDSAADALCQAVLECAFDVGCTGWDCYCEAKNCGGPSASGDGPCVAEIDAATGGQKDDWETLHTSDDTGEPIVRALNVIFCALGTNKKSPGGELPGQCETECL